VLLVRRDLVDGCDHGAGGRVRLLARVDRARGEAQGRCVGHGSQARRMPGAHLRLSCPVPAWRATGGAVRWLPSSYRPGDPPNWWNEQPPAGVDADPRTRLE